MNEVTYLKEKRYEKEMKYERKVLRELSFVALGTKALHLSYLRSIP